MGWPRKNEVARLYQEKSDKSYLLVSVEATNGAGDYSAIGNVMAGMNPSLGSTGVSPLYLLNKCRRVQWSDLPDEWKQAFRRWLEDDQTPETIRGFWHVDKFPVPTTKETDNGKADDSSPTDARRTAP